MKLRAAGTLAFGWEKQKSQVPTQWVDPQAVEGADGSLWGMGVGRGVGAVGTPWWGRGRRPHERKGRRKGSHCRRRGKWGRGGKREKTAAWMET